MKNIFSAISRPQRYSLLNEGLGPSTFFRVLACTFYLSLKNVFIFVLVPYITYDRSTWYLKTTELQVGLYPFLLKQYIYNLLFQLFSAIFL